MVDDLGALSDAEFAELRDAVAEEEKRRRRKQEREALKQARAYLAERGLDVRVVKKAERQAPIKRDIPPGLYRDPETGKEWRTGTKGKPPKWLREVYDAGEDVTRMRVEEDGEVAQED